ncbi:hypothetical protein [Kaistella montana]|uniref:Lipoprotein n=1 Tax=Kaistella montana TaxID=1849733 RepID=A0ABW5K6V6_9FLAO|nr:hypothetical protein [Kaistella montana]MCQ4034242.1 hypothetical protein [Kaistella montana]
MKKIFLVAVSTFALVSCNKIEETVNETVTIAKEKAQQKAQETIQETVNTQLSKLVNAQTVEFDSVFPNQQNLALEQFNGKKLAFPNGSPFYVFKFKTSEKDLLLKTLVEQTTTDESKSEKQFQKVDGSSIIEKIGYLEKFIPASTIDTSFLEDIKNDKNIEFYKIKRFPNVSTVIYNPKTQMVYQFVEVKK